MLSRKKKGAVGNSLIFFLSLNKIEDRLKTRVSINFLVTQCTLGTEPIYSIKDLFKLINYDSTIMSQGTFIFKYLKNIRRSV